MTQLLSFWLTIGMVCGVLSFLCGAFGFFLSGMDGRARDKEDARAILLLWGAALPLVVLWPFVFGGVAFWQLRKLWILADLHRGIRPTKRKDKSEVLKMDLASARMEEATHALEEALDRAAEND